MRLVMLAHQPGVFTRTAERYAPEMIWAKLCGEHGRVSCFTGDLGAPRVLKNLSIRSLRQYLLTMTRYIGLQNHLSRAWAFCRQTRVNSRHESTSST